MKNKIVGIFVCMLLITTCVVPVMGELITLKKSINDIKPLTSDNTRLKFMIAGKGLRFLHSYWLHVPPSYNESEPTPLVIVLHGDNEMLGFFVSRFIERYTEFSEKADEKGFIVVYPNAKIWFQYLLQGERPYHSYNCGFYPFFQNKLFIDDIGFIRDLIDKMEQEYTINSSRIFVTGFSCGGLMSYSIGSHLSDKVAAIAPVAGTIGGRASEDEPFSYIPDPENPVSVIAFHGTNDSAVAYEGSINFVSVNESISFWVEHNGCDPTPEINISESGKIIRRTYTNGENGIEVVLYTTVGGDHWWPGNPLTGTGNLIDTIQEISATDLIWDFFAAHPKQ
jgi:polyhydroxybutyrate depolymerase